MDDQHSAPPNEAVAAAMGRLESLDQVPVQQHAEIFDDVRSALRAALDVD